MARTPAVARAVLRLLVERPVEPPCAQGGGWRCRYRRAAARRRAVDPAGSSVDTPISNVHGSQKIRVPGNGRAGEPPILRRGVHGMKFVINLHKMRQALLFTSALLLALGLAACGGAATSLPAQPPPQQSQPRTEVTAPEQEPSPRLIAPPPAYGNKIVMAQGPAPRSTN